MNFPPENSSNNSTNPAGIYPMNQNIGVNSRRFSNSIGFDMSNMYKSPPFIREDIPDVNLSHAVFPSQVLYEKRHSIDFGERKDYNMIPSPTTSDFSYNENLFAAPGGPIASRSVSPDKELWNPLNYTDISKIPKSRKNSTVGKSTIKSDINLNSSTEDLLSLVNQTHLADSKAELTTSISDLSLNKKEPRLSKRNSSNSLLSDSSVDSLDVSQTKSSTCKYYTLGYCNKGSKCNYMHSSSSSPVEKVEIQKSGVAPSNPSRRNSRSNISSPSKYLNMTIYDCINKIYSMCKDQHGCRFLQKVLDEDKTPKSCQIIFDEVLPHISELMSDPFGNYLCQKLIEKCNVEQRTALIKGVSNNLVKISKNIHGTRAVQKTIELVSSPGEIKVIRDALKGNVVSLIQDLNGNHVVQKCINKLEPNDNQFIYDAVAYHCVQVSTHRHGCCVMQRCIDHASSQQRIQLVEEITNNALTLVQDAFGNYVVQYVLDLGSEEICESIVLKLLDSLYQLALQKFSSNVIEKCFKVGNKKTVKMMARQLANYRPQDNQDSMYNYEDPLIPLLQHPYGNYVIQTALHVSSIKATEEFCILAERIKANLHNLKRTPYVKKVQSLINQGMAKINSGNVQKS